MHNKLSLFLFSLLLLNFNSIIANDSDYQFRHLTLEQGLSNSNVNSIVQDANGFIWIGTENGLNKFDGYKFTHYFSDANKENSLISNEIHTLLVDSYGVLWIGTFHGLFKYNELTDNFSHISFQDIDAYSTNVPVYDIIEGTDSTIWIATSGRGLFEYNRNNSNVKVYNHSDKDVFSISSNFIYKLYKDANNSLWVGTGDGGIDRFDISTRLFYNYKPSQWEESVQGIKAVLEIFTIENNKLLIGTRGDGLFTFDTQDKVFEKFNISLKDKSNQPKEIYNIYRDSQQRLWISAHGDGLYLIKNKERAIHLVYNSDDHTGLINNNIRTLFEDSQGNLWIVSYQGGINVLPNRFKKFQIYNLNEKSDFTSNIATSVQTDKNGNLWVGTDGGGLKYINRKNNQIKHFNPGNSRHNVVNDKVVLDLMLDGENLWIGTYLKGITIYNTQTKKVTRFENNQNLNSLSSNFVSCFLKTKRGDIWVGTNGGGINKYIPETNTFKRYVMSDTEWESNLVNDFVNTIAEDNNGRLWIGTFWGLSIFDPLNGMFINHLQNDEGSVSNNAIYAIKVTSNNEIWLGTRNGLNKFIPETNSFQSFSLADGLSGNVIYSIEEDNSGNLWLSTNNGICNFNTKTFETRNYYKSDGLLSNEFFRKASNANNNKELFFGSLNGLVSFYPDSINVSYAVPEATITKFNIFNQEIIPGVEFDKELILNKPIYLTKTIELKHKYNSFGFEFSALDYVLPSKNFYKCKMEGFDQEWKTLSPDQRYVTYTNLDFGTYTFKLKASSIDNEWDDKTTNINIVVKPPLHRTWWAYTVYYILLVTIIILLWYVSIRRVKLRNQIKLERIERNKANEINKAKLQFFTNISHEFRTPLTLIIGPLEKLLKDKRVINKYNHSINTMLKNANRLLRLINQLMDMRKMEAGQMKLRTEQLDIIVFLKDIYNSFNEFAEQKKIDFRFLSEIESEIAWFDPDKIDKIIFNLLSNAFKFTDENGEIVVVVDKIATSTNSKLKISIIDTGRGIPDADIQHVFERFYQTKGNSQSHNIGSGVGLSLTKSLVEQHHGEISVKSDEHKGTEFEIILPLDEYAYSDDEKFSPEVPGVNKYIHSSPNDILEDEIAVDLGVGDKNQTLLVVEDNYDLRQYIVNEFSEFYNIIEATNGKEGLDLALQELPDIVVSDVVMPEMDGLELCRKIKENFITNHIPVILLTARASIEHRIAGIDQGADSYIPKPFNPGHLKIRIKKLLELRITLKQKYAQELSSPETKEVEDEDIYLKEIKDLILNNLDEPDLSIEKICKEMGISRAHFYRKIKLMTDKSPTEFVRIIRLNESAKLLLKTNKSISEICYMVGFNSPSYFSICFKEHFKMSPIEFVKKNQKKESED